MTVPLNLSYDELQFLRDLVGGTGDFVWGDLARHYGLSGADVEAIYHKLQTASVDRGLDDLLTAEESR